MLLDFIQKLLGIKNDSLELNNKFVRTNNRVDVKNVKYSTPAFDLNNSNVVHPELKNEKEIEDLYAEIRVLQAKNREKVNKNKISYHISK